MAETPSTMLLPLGAEAPPFDLPVPGGERVSRKTFEGAPALLVAFLCNHCPYVKHVQGGLAALVREWQPRGLAAVGISANDAEAYPEDAPGKMAAEARRAGYTFPYAHDETQEVAKAYHAACTPDFFLFDGARRLVYRGQMDGSRPGNDVPVTGEDLRAAIDAVLEGRPVPEGMRPSVGCNIKWRAGNEPREMRA